MEGENRNPAKVKRKTKTPFQLRILEKTYAKLPRPSYRLRLKLSMRLGLTFRQVTTWFSNRRLKDKRSISHSSSSSCPYDHAHGVDPDDKNTSSNGNDQAVGSAEFVSHQSASASQDATAGKNSPQILSGLHIEFARSNHTRRNEPGNGETEEPSELKKDASTKSDDEMTYVNPNNTRAAETKPLHESYLVNSLLKSLLEKDGTNFLQWYRSLRILLRCENKLYVLETPVPEEPPATAAKATTDAWIKHKTDSSEVQGVMLITMVPDLQKIFEHFGAYEMLNELKVMFRGQVRQECFETVTELFGCKMAEGSSVSSHIVKMKSYIERLKTLDYPISNEWATFSILNSLPKSYDEFVQNFIMNNQEMSVSDLDKVLKAAEMNKYN
ncbi:hypothetical protein SSX86_010113 [Deinandra increscens subsp. villosa]|uniref:Homeobox domain-containing protein n=1 Tax=Deinandra increscens subsp. villosa TaxID=3103831 RepID=A0AAP0H259_9ASTR